MVDENVLPFPFPQDSLSFQDRMADVVKLSDDVRRALEADKPLTDIRDLLARLEAATAILRQIGDLVLRGSARLKTEEQFSDVEQLILSARRKLDQIDAVLRPPPSQ